MLGRRVAKLGLCSTLKTIDKGGIFIVPIPALTRGLGLHGLNQRISRTRQGRGSEDLLLPEPRKDTDRSSRDDVWMFETRQILYNFTRFYPPPPSLQNLKLWTFELTCLSVCPSVHLSY